jgi:acyl carrier protein
VEKLLNIVNEMLEESGRERLEGLDQSFHLRDDLHMDSFMLAEFTVRVEAEYGIDIFEDGIVETIGEVMAKINGG